MSEAARINLVDRAPLTEKQQNVYEKLIEGASSPDDYVSRLYDFVEEFQERFNEDIASDEILKLCSK